MMKRSSIVSFTAAMLVSSSALAGPIALRVAGAGVSATALAPRIGAELDADVAAATDACAAPCLDVVVVGTRATVRFTPIDGPPRTRTIALGADRDAWPVLITLLAGNLARDEAQDVLAMLPAPAPAVPRETDPQPVGSPAEVDVPTLAPPVAPPAPIFAASAERAPAPSAEIDESTFVIGLVPGLSTDFTDLGVHHDLALHLAIGVGGGLDGISLAGAADVERGPVDGIQISGAINVARALDGAQLAGAINVAGDVDGFQAAGAVNVAGTLDGTQIAGGVNVAGDVDGLQIAPINVAGHVDGTQIGVINVGRAGDGVSIGLINIVPGGRTDVEASVDTRALGTVLLRHGSRHWHNVYGVGGQRAEDTATTTTMTARDDLWMAGLGLGPTWRTAGATFDLDAIAWHVSTGARTDRGPSLLNQLRLTAAFELGPVALVAGGAINVYVGDRAAAPYLAQTVDPTAPMPGGGVGVHAWPTLFVGVRM